MSPSCDNVANVHDMSQHDVINVHLHHADDVATVPKPIPHKNYDANGSDASQMMFQWLNTSNTMMPSLLPKTLTAAQTSP